MSTFDQQKILFGQDVTARFLKFTSLSGFGSDTTSALAELAVLYTGPALADNSAALEYKRVQSASTDIDENLGADEKKKKAK